MFSGIVHAMGIVRKIEEKGKGFWLSIEHADTAQRVAAGASVCVSGVCLTVCEKEGEVLRFEAMPETLRKTTLGDKKVGDPVNLETSLRVGDDVGGHFVFGHVDGVALVSGLEREGDNLLVAVRPSKNLMKYLAPQGSVALDGVSLTVARLGEADFTVSLITYTLQNTTLGGLLVGDRVNMEADMLAKYVERMCVITPHRQ